MFSHRMYALRYEQGELINCNEKLPQPAGCITLAACVNVFVHECNMICYLCYIPVKLNYLQAVTMSPWYST